MKYNMKESVVLKMGNKCGVFLGNDYENIFKIKKGETIELEITSKNKKATLISRMNYNIVLRRSIENRLNLKRGCRIRYMIRKVTNLKRPKKFFYKNKIDILSLIPEKTSKGYEIIVIPFNRKDKWLRIWYSHSRGSGRQFEIKRYLDIQNFSSMLGQLQAEGTKKESLVEFPNTLLSEHKDFTNSLNSIGIQNIKFFKANHAYITVVRYLALSSILLNSMNIIRKSLINKKLEGNLKIAANSFFSKVLTGDGTISIGKRKVPQISIKIVDRNRKYLEDYKKIMKKLGFNPHINYNHIYVKSSCSFENMIYLYRIEAFKNSNNWNKLIISIKILLEGRRLKTYYRFLELKNKSVFTSLDIRNLYDVGLRAANDWINNNKKSGYIKKLNDSIPIKYKITKNGIDLANTLEKIEDEYGKIKTKKDISNIFELLDSLKTRNQPKRELIQGHVT